MIIELLLMAEEVFDSWEDMIDENGVLDKKLQDLRIAESSTQMTPIMTSNLNSSIRSSMGSSNDSVWPSIRSNNNISDNYSSIKILKRPTNSTASDPSINSSPNIQTNSIGPQIMLEDNTRTQFVPQVRILKRPNARTSNESDKSMSSIDRTANRSQSNSKTYEEREAEYAKARLRILGSASAQEETNSSTELNSCQLSNGSNSNKSIDIALQFATQVVQLATYDSSGSSGSSNSSNTLSPTNSGSIKSNNGSANNTPISSTKLGSVNSYNDLNNVPVIRLPQGPDGTKGFNYQKR